MNQIYFDYSASTPLDSSVLDVMLPYLRDRFGNPSSVHHAGRETRVAIDDARERLAATINASPGEIVFTSGGTEADNLAIWGIAQRQPTPGHVITSLIEHPAVLNTCRALEQNGWQVSYIKPDATGRVSVDAVREQIRPSTALISVMHANNEIGTINPVAEIAELAASSGITFHTDAVQSFGKIALDMQHLPATLLSFSAHKFYGPKGCGGLYVRTGTRLMPMLFGGHQERDRRAGTENTAAIVGMGHAAELAVNNMKRDQAHLAHLSRYFWEKLKNVWPPATLNGHPTERLSGVLNVSFELIDSVALATRLDVADISVSTGAACSSGSPEPSKVLEAMGLSRERSTTALRISFGRPTTIPEIDRAVEVFGRIYSGLAADVHVRTI